MRRFAAVRFGVAAGLLVLAASACGGSAKSPAVSAAASPIPTQDVAVSPSPATATAPAKTVTAPKPKPPAPLSAYESDPAVKDLRAYYVAAARAINARNFRLPALLALSTPGRAARHQSVFGSEVGLYYPGPAPFTPLGVRTVAAGHKQIITCGIDNGWGLTRKGGRAAHPLSVLGIRTDMLLTGGRWHVDHVRAAHGTTCSGVRIGRRNFA